MGATAVISLDLAGNSNGRYHLYHSVLQWTRSYVMSFIMVKM